MRADQLQVADVFVITKSGEEIEIIFAVPGNLNAFTLNKQHTR